MRVVGPDVASGQAPQTVVEAGVWQSARPLGGYSLVGATVTPAFTFEGFELRRDRGEPPPAARLLLGRVGSPDTHEETT